MLVSCHRQFNADLPLLIKIVGFVAAFAMNCGFCLDRVKAQELAAKEAIMNVINYGYKGLSETQVSLQCVFERPTLTVEIIDSREAFNPLGIPYPNLPDNLEDRKFGAWHLLYKELC